MKNRLYLNWCHIPYPPPQTQLSSEIYSLRKEQAFLLPNRTRLGSPNYNEGIGYRYLHYLTGGWVCPDFESLMHVNIKFLLFHHCFQVNRQQSGSKVVSKDKREKQKASKHREIDIKSIGWAHTETLECSKVSEV